MPQCVGAGPVCSLASTTGTCAVAVLCWVLQTRAQTASPAVFLDERDGGRDGEGDKFVYMTIIVI